MPVVESLMKSLVDRHGKAKGESIYYGMEASGHGPFAPGGKYRKLHEDFAKKNGVPPSAALKTKKKPAPPKVRRARKARAKPRG